MELKKVVNINRKNYCRWRFLTGVGGHEKQDNFFKGPNALHFSHDDNSYLSPDEKYQKKQSGRDLGTEPASQTCFCDHFEIFSHLFVMHSIHLHIIALR